MLMNEKRFVLCKKGDKEYIEDNGCVQLYGFDVLCEMLNEQQEEISYWKHRVSSLLFILSQFDNEKVKKLLEELDEREKIYDKDEYGPI